MLLRYTFISSKRTKNSALPLELGSTSAQSNPSSNNEGDTTPHRSRNHQLILPLTEAQNTSLGALISPATRHLRKLDLAIQSQGRWRRKVVPVPLSGFGGTEDISIVTGTVFSN
ncbi:hypothetical protein TNCT_227531 [Trichonephila clavata]|uniref:Uncharacterized protein n=1 Tax=Trichonephila clavata TaxID=2740835 RepID=A0A8X6EWK0_TRICU|nr:hypothetical protein TNCT_227531 [Trichonephila clavata]